MILVTNMIGETCLSFITPSPPHFSDTHTTHDPSNPFSGTSFGFYYDKDMMQEQRAHEEERDGLFYAMYELQQDMMEFIRESQCQTECSLRLVLEAQATMAAQQMRL